MKKIQAGLVLARGAEFEGKLSFEGAGRICGQFKGQIFTKGLLVIEPGARVEAQVKAQEVVVKGWMKGEAAAQAISLLSGSEFHGVLKAPRLQIEEGALFEGQALKTFAKEDKKIKSF